MPTVMPATSAWRAMTTSMAIPMGFPTRATPASLARVWMRLATVRMQMVLLVPLSTGIGLLVRADAISVGIIYAFMFVVGLGWVSDMTSRRALILDLVGSDRLDKAMAMESLSLSTGMVLGAVLGGYAVDALGIASSYMLVGGLSFVGFLALVPVTTPPKLQRSSSDSPLRDLAEGLAVVRRNRSVLSILGITMIANFFMFSFFPIVPALADELGAEPFYVGLLAGGTGIGMMTGSLLFARWTPDRRGLVYVGGVALGMVFLVPFGLAGIYGLALAAVIGTGIGAGFFGSTQSTLVMGAVSDEMRGRALGLLSMAIGALPVGMYALGELAEWIGVGEAIAASSCCGGIAMALWLWRHPEVLVLEG